MTKYGYARVSTNGQDLSDQIEQLTKEGAEEIFSEKYTGTKVDRPEFDRLLDTVQPGDTVMVMKLDRFARTTEDALSVMRQLQTHGVTLWIENMGTFDTKADGTLTPIAKVMRTVMLAFAEFERDMIVERTQSGKRYAKEHNANYHEGRPKRIITPRYRHAYEVLMEGHSYTEVERMTGIPRATVWNIKKQIEAEDKADASK